MSTPLLSSSLTEAQPLLERAGFDLPLSLAVLAGIAALYLLYLTLRPLIEEGEISSDEWARIEDESFELIQRRDRVIDELKDLEFEAAMNKLDDRDLSALRGRYEREALQLIQALDEQSAAYQTDIQAEVTAQRDAARARRAQQKTEVTAQEEMKSEQASSPASSQPQGDESQESEADMAEEGVFASPSDEMDSPEESSESPRGASSDEEV